MKTVMMVTLGVAISLMSLSLLAADAPSAQPAAGTSTSAPASTRPTSRPADPEVSADAVIRALLESRTKTPVLPRPQTAPASQPASVAPASIIRPLPMPPGAMIRSRLGRIVKDKASRWWTFHFESERTILYEAPMRILPNRQLEAMENILDSSARPGVRFLVSGEVTQYRGKRYLLIRKKLVKREMGGN